MQKKKINTILLITVAIIWIVVIYKFVSPYFATTSGVITAEALVAPLEINIRKKDSFKLMIPQRDPFLGKINRKTVQVNPQPRKKIRKPRVKNKTPQIWPKIQYLGFVKAARNTDKLALIRFDGVLKRIRKNQVYKDIKVIKIEDNQVLLALGKENKIFSLN